jgi:hypothetical protein
MQASNIQAEISITIQNNRSQTLIDGFHFFAYSENQYHEFEFISKRSRT